MTKRTVKVKLEGMHGGELTVAGGNVANNIAPGAQLSDKGGDVDLDAKNINGRVVAAGGDVIDFANQVAAPLDELVELLKMGLTQKNQIENLQEIVRNLKDQIKDTANRSNESKIKTLLDNLGSFLGLTTLAATQVEKAHQLFEVVKNLLPSR